MAVPDNIYPQSGKMLHLIMFEIRATNHSFWISRRPLCASRTPLRGSAHCPCPAPPAIIVGLFRALANVASPPCATHRCLAPAAPCSYSSQSTATEPRSPRELDGQPPGGHLALWKKRGNVGQHFHVFF
jgi:hypothetical protein